MKYIKKFENVDFKNDVYWIVNPKYRFDVIMYKMNMSEENIDIFNKLLSDDKFDFNKSNKICIVYHEGNNWFSWDEYNKESLDWFKRHRYKYMGDLNVTPEEIEKYEIEKQTRKYNL